MTRLPFALAIGNLMYVVVYTRLDISYVAGIDSRLMSNSRKAHRKDFHIHTLVDIKIQGII